MSRVQASRSPLAKAAAVVAVLLAAILVLPPVTAAQTGTESSGGDEISVSTYRATVSRRIPATQGAEGRTNTKQADRVCARYGTTSSSVFVPDAPDPEPESESDGEADTSGAADPSGEAAPMSLLGTEKTSKSATATFRLALFQPGLDLPDLGSVIGEITNQSTSTVSVPGGVLTTTTTTRCIAEYHCNAERIDDLRLGQLSGGGFGTYAEYIAYVGGVITHVGGGMFPDFELDLGAVGESLSAGLGTQPTLASIPMMYYCRVMYGDTSHFAHNTIEVAAPGFFPQFDWGTNILAEYDVPGARADLLIELLAALDGRRPQMQTIPPVETGYTFVKLPMWLWIEEPLVLVEMEAINDLNTVRLATRATLRHVEWVIDGVPITCTVDQMTAFENGVDSIADPPPFCMHRFLDLTDHYTMKATAVYDVEEQLSYRGATTFDWTDTGWVDHPSNPEVPLDNETPPMTVREIISVTVPVGISADELEALAGSG